MDGVYPKECPISRNLENLKNPTLATKFCFLGIWSEEGSGLIGDDFLDVDVYLGQFLAESVRLNILCFLGGWCDMDGVRIHDF